MTLSNPQYPSSRSRRGQPADDCVALALKAIVWTISQSDRADRLLAITGLAPADLRRRLADPSLLAAAIGFLEANEADLMACAKALGIAPIQLVHAREALEQ